MRQARAHLPVLAIVLGVADGAAAARVGAVLPDLGGEHNHTLLGADTVAGAGEDAGPLVLLHLLGYVHILLAPGLAIVIGIHHAPLAGLVLVETGLGNIQRSTAAEVADQRLHPDTALLILQNAGVAAAICAAGAGIHAHRGRGPGLAAIRRAHGGHVDIGAEVAFVTIAGIEGTDERALLRLDDTGNAEGRAGAGLGAIRLVIHRFTGHGQHGADSLGHGAFRLGRIFLAVHLNLEIIERNRATHQSLGGRLHVEPEVIIATLQLLRMAKLNATR